jgi:uncharacterized protein
MKANLSILLLFFASTIFTNTISLAQNQLSLGQLAQGEMVLNVSATEQRQVAQDTLNASLEISAQGKDKVALQDQVNKAMQQALAVLKTANNTAIHYQTTSYQVYIINAEPGLFSSSNALWRAQQSVQLDSVDSAKLLELVGELQTLGLTVSNLNYTLSSAKYEEVAAELSSKVLLTLQQRADSAAKVLKLNHARLVEVSLDGNANFAPANVRSYDMMTLASEKIATPTADPGETQVTVSVAARAILSP